LVVDPGDDKLVLQAIESAGLDLTHILVTHHHWDHIAGIEALKGQTGCEIVGPDQERVPLISHLVKDGDRLELGPAYIDVLATSGHTRSSVCYYCPPDKDDPNGRLWTGDTLFMGGCGRLFECAAAEMWRSLQRICSLPDTSVIYGGHDYAKENYQFSLSIEPNNREVKQRLQEVTHPASPGNELIPTTLGIEKRTNIFLRSNCPKIRSVVGDVPCAAAHVFAELRARKDRY